MANLDCESGRRSENGVSVSIYDPERRQFRAESTAKQDVTAWARRDYLQHLNPTDEPEWLSVLELPTAPKV